MFSIVIPLYNKELSIINTLQSVLDQTFKEFEIIIVNDGSTDNSLEKVKLFNDNRIRIITQENGGVSRARNRGIKEARYDWIAFLNADDLWYPEKLSLVNKELAKDSNLELVTHAFERVFVNSNKITAVKYRISGVLPSLLEAIVDGLIIQTSTVTINKSLFLNDQRLMFREGVNNSEDRELWYKLACLKTPTAYISETLSKYIVDPGIESLTGNKNKEYHFLMMRDKLDEFIGYLNKTDKNNIHHFLKKFNSQQIANYWVTLNFFPNAFRKHIPKYKFVFFENTIWFPVLIKKIINKLLFQ